MKAASKKFPSVIYEVTELESGNVILTPIQLIEGYHKEGTTINDLQPKTIKKKSFLKSYECLDELEVASMQHNRAKRKIKAKPFVPNPFFLRQSMISSYLQCPDKFYDTYENGYSESTIFTQMGTAIHGVMEDYYADKENANVPELFKKWWAEYGPNEPELYEEWKGLIIKYFEQLKEKPEPNIIARELEFKTKIGEVPFSGTIDRIDRLDENTILVVDYKSNQQPYSMAELKGSVQFKSYVLALMTDELHEVLGEYDTIVCAYDMLRTGNRQFISYTAEELETFKEWLLIIWSSILSGKDRNPKINKYCGYCQKRHKCQAYDEMLKSPTSIVSTDDIDLNNIADELVKLKESKKIIEGRITELEGIIKSEIIKNGDAVTLNNTVWSMRSQKTTTYPVTGIFDIIKEDKEATEMVINALSPLSATAIKKIKILKTYQEEIDKIAEEAYKSPSLKANPIKE